MNAGSRWRRCCNFKEANRRRRTLPMRMLPTKSVSSAVSEPPAPSPPRDASSRKATTCYLSLLLLCRYVMDVLVCMFVVCSLLSVLGSKRGCDTICKRRPCAPTAPNRHTATITHDRTPVSPPPPQRPRRPNADCPARPPPRATHRPQAAAAGRGRLWGVSASRAGGKPLPLAKAAIFNYKQASVRCSRLSQAPSSTVDCRGACSPAATRLPASPSSSLAATAAPSFARTPGATRSARSASFRALRSACAASRPRFGSSWGVGGGSRGCVRVN